MWGFLGSIASGLGSIFGASKQADTQSAINQQNIQNQDMINNQNIQAQEIINQLNMQNQQDINNANIAFQSQTNAQNIAEQEKFAQNSIQWKVQDAIKAGLNPLAALGAAGSSFSNVVAPQEQASAVAKAPNISASATSKAPDLASSYTAAGQSLGRALAAIMSPEDQAMQQLSTVLDLQSKQLNNDYIRAKINELNAPGSPPGVPGLGGPGVKIVPDKVTATDPASAGVVTAGIHPDVELTRMANGNLYPTIPSDQSTSQFNIAQQIRWAVQNMLLPTVGYNMAVKDSYFDPVFGYYSKKSGDPANAPTADYWLRGQFP